MMKKKKGSSLLTILKGTAKGVRDDNILKLSASLAYATLFSIIPFISLLVTIGAYFHTDLGNSLYTQLEPILGPDAVSSLREVITNAVHSDASSWAAIISLAVMIFGASAIFTEIQGSLNIVWGIKAVPKREWLKYLVDRVLSFSIIVVFAFILLITFSVSTLIQSLGDRILAGYPDITETVVNIAGTVVNIVVTCLIFTLIFKFLPDAKIKFKDVIVGALFTTILFLVGQWAISLYINVANVGSVYGAAAFLIILITWIYYSAVIIYIGAEFTESWANELGGRIVPDEYAVSVKRKR